jgi:hypothetical protein
MNHFEKMEKLHSVAPLFGTQSDQLDWSPLGYILGAISRLIGHSSAISLGATIHSSGQHRVTELFGRPPQEAQARPHTLKKFVACHKQKIE